MGTSCACLQSTRGQGFVASGRYRSGSLFFAIFSILTIIYLVAARARQISSCYEQELYFATAIQNCLQAICAVQTNKELGATCTWLYRSRNMFRSPASRIINGMRWYSVGTHQGWDQGLRVCTASCRARTVPFLYCTSISRVDVAQLVTAVRHCAYREEPTHRR